MRTLLWCLASFVLLPLVRVPVVRGEVAAVENVRDRNVVGGLDAPVGRFPYVCTMREGPRNDFSCSAVLVHPRIALTAAHCVYNVTTLDFLANPVVWCGQELRDLFVRNLVFRSRAQIANCYWNPPRSGCDIAFLVLDRPANLPVPQMPMQGEPAPMRGQFKALGWGAEQYYPLRWASRLQMTDYIHICGSQPPRQHYSPPTEIQICPSFYLQDLCRGDSGGPLIDADLPGGFVYGGYPGNDRLVGIDSYGSKWCDASMPQAFTQVSPFVNEINQLIRQL